jgi:polyisoprenoid-binding protein YceI
LIAAEGATMRSLALTALVLATLSDAAAAAPIRFQILPGAAGNQVSFLSKAPLETVEGKTNQVSGSVVVDPADLAAGCEVEVTVDLASLDTGIGKRNQHMRENHLETDRFPQAVFRADSLSGAPALLAAGAPVPFTLVGDFSLHGVTHRIAVPATVTLSADGMALAVTAAFTVKLADYSIARPQFLVMKLDELQQVSVALTAQRQPEGD